MRRLLPTLSAPLVARGARCAVSPGGDRLTRSGGAFLCAATMIAALATAACQTTPPARKGSATVRAVARPGAGAPAAEPARADPLAEIASRRASFRRAFLSAQDGAERHKVLRKAARYLEGALIHTVLPRWDGTPWSFSGTSTTPGSGSIACGYFVSTTLREAGLRVERRRLAQQAAEDIIKTLAPPEAITRFSDAPMERFTETVAARGDGLYVVGLDIHVGFLIVRGGKVFFHHSSYVGPMTVVREEAAASSPLVGSRYRVVAKLFTDDHLVESWLQDTPVPTKVPARR